jgi:hypothetical protein
MGKGEDGGMKRRAIKMECLIIGDDKNDTDQITNLKVASVSQRNIPSTNVLALDGKSHHFVPVWRRNRS